MIKQRAINPLWMANISSSGVESSKIKKKIQTSLPIFYLADELAHSPKVYLVKPTNNRQERKDKKVGGLPFLESLNVYRSIIVN